MQKELNLGSTRTENRKTSSIRPWDVAGSSTTGDLPCGKEGYENGEKIGYSQTSAMLTELKKQEEFAFLKAADSIALQQSLRDLDRGFVNSFRNGLPIQPSKVNITGSSHTER